MKKCATCSTDLDGSPCYLPTLGGFCSARCVTLHDRPPRARVSTPYNERNYWWTKAEAPLPDNPGSWGFGG